MKAHFTLLILLFALFFQCKPTQNTALSESEGKTVFVMVLLENQVLPKEISSLQSFDQENMKRTSRSQNLWMIEVEESTVLTLIEGLKKDSKVLDAYESKDSPSSSTSKSTKSGKTDTIKN